jgi:hypothetical protein
VHYHCITLFSGVIFKKIEENIKSILPVKPGVEGVKEVKAYSL